MDGLVQPKFGLMVSLILMNLTAIALFFFATPTSREISKEPVDNAENTLQANMVVAGDAQTTIGVPRSNEKKASTEEGIVSNKMSKADTKRPRFSLAEVQTLPGKVEMRVINMLNTPKKTNELETSDTPTEPPLVIALKKFVGDSGSGVRIFFEGLKNGYTKKRIRESVANNISIMKSKTTQGFSGSSRSTLISDSSPQRPNVNPPRNPKELSPISGPGEDGSVSNHETIPAEIVMDALSRAQKRTNELINVFSKKVVPAIERMNDQVAEAVRLEKNLDSYTSALINAINSVVCPSTDTEMNLKHKQSKQGASTLKKLRHTKPFCSELSLMRDSRICDYIGSYSKGEHSSLNKRPVFKTLAARCWHTRHRRTMNKMKKHSSRPEEVTRPEDSGQLQLKQENLVSKCETAQVVLDQTDRCETKDYQESGNINLVKKNQVTIPTNTGICKGSLKFTESPYQRTIGIEEVLALTSSFDQSSDQGIQPEKDRQPFQSPQSSNPSLSSGMACRSCVVEPPEPRSIVHTQTENESHNVSVNLEQTESLVSAVSQSLELPEDSAGQAKQQEEPLCSDFSIVFDSRIQGYDSYLAQKEIGTVSAYSPENEETQVTGSSQRALSHSKRMNQRGESNHSVSFSGNVKNTMELVSVFQQLTFQQKEVAMENVCLLVLRIFEAWTESQRSTSSMGLSRISLSSWPSTDEVSSQCSRPRTAICRSRIDSAQEQKSIIANSLPKDNGLDEYKPAINEITMESGQISADISRTLVHNVFEAADIQIAERSLKGLRTNVLRNSPSKGDIPTRCIGSADIANQSGFGDTKEPIIGDEVLTVSLMSKSRESIKVSKESSAATFYTGQPESSEDAFYECASTMSAGTCEGYELEVKDSSTLFLERIQEEEMRVHKSEGTIEGKHAVIAEPQAAGSSLSIESWLTDSGDELIAAKENLNSEEFPASDISSFDVACGTDDEAYPCSSQDLSADEFKAENKKKDRSKKKKWAAKFLNKFLKKKSKPSSLPSVALSKNALGSHSDSALKPDDQDPVVKDGESAQ